MSAMNCYDKFPKTMFRLNSGKAITLRQFEKGKTSYDVITDNGKVKPIQDLKTYIAPNGASMRPEGTMLTKLVGGFKGSNVTVYKVPEGTKIPKELVLVHEHTDHYSLQPRVAMSVEALNTKLNSFYSTFAKAFDREAWLAEYKATTAATATTATTASTNKPKDPKKDSKAKGGKK